MSDAINNVYDACDPLSKKGTFSHMSSSTRTEREPTVEEILSDPVELLGVVARRLDADWTTYYPFLLLVGSVVLGLVVTIDGGSGGPEALAPPPWAVTLVEALMPLVVLFVYPVGIVASYLVARLVFDSERTDVMLALAIVAGVATATKAASIMFGAIF